jgi:rhodanese-related sulfurtransferase
MNIPGSINVPGAELVYRVHDVAPHPQTMVVVNCAGRTRSIIGAQSLRNAGMVNRVAALKNGTMGWHLAGFELEHGQDRRATPPSLEGLAKARAAAARVEMRFGVRKVGRAMLERWGEEREQRTVYILDVRLPEEFEAGHLEGARSAPGGQLVQATDEYVPVRNARVVLVDDTEVRAIMTASWLIQMGWTEVYVLDGGLGDAPLVPGSASTKILGFEKGESLTPIELKAIQDSGEPAALIDLASSVQYRDRHIRGAWWCTRSALGSGVVKNLPHGEMLVLISFDGMLAHLAAKDLKACQPRRRVRVLEGGTRAWIDAGLSTAGGIERALCDIDDVWYKPYESRKAPEQAMRDYLSWEVALLEQIERDDDATFRAFT